MCFNDDIHKFHGGLRLHGFGESSEDFGNIFAENCVFIAMEVVGGDFGDDGHVVREPKGRGRECGVPVKVVGLGIVWWLDCMTFWTNCHLIGRF